MACETTYLLQLIGCILRGAEAPCPPTHVDMEELYRQAFFHGIGNLPAYAPSFMNGRSDDPWVQEFSLERDLAFTRDVNQSFARSELLESWKLRGLIPIEVQGTRMKTLYPSPEMRTMSDLDFIVKPEDLATAGETLEALGYTITARQPWEIDACREPNILVEVHTSFFPPDSPYRAALPDPFSIVGEDGQVSDTYFYLYSLLHTAKHYDSKGCGIRRIMDVFVMDRMLGHSLDHDLIRDTLHRAGLTDFAARLSALGQAWFAQGTMSPDCREMERYLLRSGIHGLEQHYMDKQVYNGTTSTFPKTRYFMRRLFGTGRELRERYPVLERCKLLYPLCGIHRLLRGVFRMGKNGAKEEALQIFRSDSQHRPQGTYLKEPSLETTDEPILYRKE